MVYKKNLSQKYIFLIIIDKNLTLFLLSADHEHMIDLKHAIHVKEVNEAPAHEEHVLELHR